MPHKGYQPTTEHRQRISNSRKGKGLKFLSEEHKEKIGLSKLGKKRPPLSIEWRRKIGEAMKGNTYALGNKLTVEQRQKISAYMKGKKHVNRALTNQRILDECEELRRQGFRAVPTGGHVIPDIVAIKDNKVYAVEVEYGKPNYNKYTGKEGKYFDDIIWVLRKKVKESA